MESCIYEGRVWHRRRIPIEYEFDFSLFMLYLDLDELPELFERSWFWSAERPAFARFRRADHVGDASLRLDDCVRDVVSNHTGQRPLGPIRLLTQLRYAGFSMNPVSFYYCFDSTGTEVEAIVAEVNNTPWGERHCYVVPSDSSPSRKVLSARTRKEFHVSPFMGMNLDYHWKVNAPGRRLELRIENVEREDDVIFEAALGMNRVELTPWSRARMLIRYPLISLQTFSAIYWHAIRLHFAGALFHPHPRQSAGSLETMP